MQKKIKIVIGVILVLILGVVLYVQNANDQFKVQDDEIALHIRLDTKEDIGLIVFDYTVDGHAYSGGIANADRSLLRHDSESIQVWNKQELNTSSDSVDISVQFRIITEYTEPNYENIYPEHITKKINVPISWHAAFGQEYFVTITGGSQSGYTAELKQ